MFVGAQRRPDYQTRTASKPSLLEGHLGPGYTYSEKPWGLEPGTCGPGGRRMTAESAIYIWVMYLRDKTPILVIPKNSLFVEIALDFDVPFSTGKISIRASEASVMHIAILEYTIVLLNKF